MDNLDNLLRELEVKEKSQHNKQPDSRRQQQGPANELARTSIIEQQRDEIERLKAQLSIHQASNVTLDFTGPSPPSASNTPATPTPNQNIQNNSTPVYNRGKQNWKPKPRYDAINNAKTNNNNSDKISIIHEPSNYRNNNNTTVNKINEAIKSNTTPLPIPVLSDEDLELEKLKAQLAYEESILQKKKEAEKLRQDIERLRSVNSNNNNNNNNNGKFNNTAPVANQREMVLMGEIAHLKRELGSSEDSGKARIEELERMLVSMKGELQSVRSKGPIKPDPIAEQRIEDLGKKRLELQRELSSGPSREELVAQQEKNKRELNDIQFGIDVCFLMDCTGSMKAFIRAAKENINRVVAQIKNIDARAILRFAFVGYRDYGDAKQHELLDFVDSSNLVAFEKFVGSIQAIGGDDAPEDVAGGLDFCTSLDIADAPCHGSKYYTFDPAYDQHRKKTSFMLSMTLSSYPNGDPNGLNPEAILKQLLNIQVDYYFLRMARHTDAMVAIFKKVYAAAKKTFEEHSVGSNPANFLPKVVASIHSSMSQSVQFRK